MRHTRVDIEELDASAYLDKDGALLGCCTGLLGTTGRALAASQRLAYSAPMPGARSVLCVAERTTHRAGQ